MVANWPSLEAGREDVQFPGRRASIVRLQGTLLLSNCWATRPVTVSCPGAQGDGPAISLPIQKIILLSFHEDV
jgi:hypothetical protein